MVTDEAINIVKELKQKFGLGLGFREEINPRRYHVTGLKMIEIIFDTIKPIVDAEINKQWLDYPNKTTRVENLKQWVDKSFLLPLSNEIKSLIETEEQNRIYRGIMRYILKVTDRIDTITPWDVINGLTNDRGESLIKLVQFPPKTISVKFDDIPLPNIYNLDLDQFMGMVLASKLIVFSTNTTILEITTPIDSFLLRLAHYNENQYYRIDATYGLEVTQQVFRHNTEIFKFKSMSFIQGFMIPFSWVELDHHKYWTKFTQYPQGEELTF